MGKIRSKNTGPEKLLRSQLFLKGFRFRIHRSDLPGKPDIVLPKFKTAIYVHGCFWHFHEACPGGHMPKTNSNYWELKFEKNLARDKNNLQELQRLGWQVVVIWECELKNKDMITKKINELISFLELPNSNASE